MQRESVLTAANLSHADLACVIPHQANIRIIEGVAERLGIPMEKFFINLDRYKNTSAAATAIALDEAHRAGRFRSGDHILLATFGAGFTYGASVVR
jgi:3-oxoacyl-[acyl-carrier-protein] synthase III